MANIDPSPGRAAAEPLAAHHVEHLKGDRHLDESEIAAVVRAGVYSLTDPGVQRPDGWGKDAVPGLAIPYLHPTTGELWQTRIRPDTPRVGTDGKAAKYLSATGSRSRLYFPPGMEAILWDAAQDVLLTEGEFKAILTTHAGFPAISVAGVWNWRQREWRKDLVPDTPGAFTIEDQDKVIDFNGRGWRGLPDFDLVLWEGRRVYLVFDSDAATNAQVRKALEAAAGYLNERGAIAYTVRIPAGPDGQKVGVDDFLKQEGPDALRALLADTPAPLVPAGTITNLLDAIPKDATGAALDAALERLWPLVTRQSALMQHEVQERLKHAFGLTLKTTAKGIKDATQRQKHLRDRERAILAQVRPAARRSLPPEPFPADADEDSFPPGTYKVRSFLITGEGVWWEDPEPGEDGPRPPVQLCARMDVVACTRSADGDDWGRLLVFKDADGTLHEWAMPMALLAGDGTAFREMLLSKGLTLGPTKRAKNLLMEYVQTAIPARRVRCVSRIGWHGASYVLPAAAFGPPGERVLLQRGEEVETTMRIAGTLADWQAQVAAPCRGNSRLMFAVSAAFAAPLLEIIGEDSGGFHFRGGSSTGKTTALLVAGSVWGGGDSGYIQRWRATSNGLEAIAEAHCDALLILDELAQVAPQEAGEIAYMLANGAGRIRATRSGGAKRKAKWRLLFLSAGEIGLADHMRSGGKQVRGGQEIRLADIPADAGGGLGVFEETHGVDPDTFSRQLSEAARRFYGSPIREFLAQVVQHRHELKAVKAFRADFLARQVPVDAVGEVSRVAGRFALVAAAGELAIDSGILPWSEGEALAAAGACFDAWLKARGSHHAGHVEAAIAQIRAFIEAHGSSRFDWLGPQPQQAEGVSESRILNRVGFRRTVDGQDEYLVLGEAFRREVCAGHDPAAAAKALADRGYLIAGSEDGKLTTKMRLPGLGRVSFYRILATIMEGT